MKTDGLDDAFNVETSIVPAEVEKVQKKEKQKLGLEDCELKKKKIKDPKAKKLLQIMIYPQKFLLNSILLF